jgi:hypothetical protein
MIGLACGASALGLLWFNKSQDPPLECPAVIDLGEIDLKHLGQTTLTVKNSGRSALVLANFEKTCGCTATYGSHGNALTVASEETVQPGSELDLRVQFNAASMNPGPFQHRIQFTSNDPQRPVFSVLVVGDLRHGVYAIPKEVVAGRLRPGFPSTICFRLVDGRRRSRRAAFTLEPSVSDVRIESVRETDNKAGLSASSYDSIVYEVVASVTPIESESNRPFAAHVRVLDNHHDVLCSIPISGSIRHPVMLSPSVILMMLDRKSKAASMTRKCICECEDAALKIGVRDCPSQLHVGVLENGSSSQKTIEVTYVGSEESENTKLTIRLRASKIGAEPVDLILPVIIRRE